MKITNESVAKALGWRVVTWRGEKYSCAPGEKFSAKQKKQPSTGWWPHYTISLDAIVAEIEGRGLTYRLVADTYRPESLRTRTFQAEIRGYEVCEHTTAPLALCAALLAYLKEPKP